MPTQQEERMKLYTKWDNFWAEESQYTSQTNLTPDTRGIIIDFFQSEINLAVDQRDKEIVEMIEKLDTVDIKDQTGRIVKEQLISKDLLISRINLITKPNDKQNN